MEASHCVTHPYTFAKNYPQPVIIEMFPLKRERSVISDESYEFRRVSDGSRVAIGILGCVNGRERSSCNANQSCARFNDGKLARVSGCADVFPGTFNYSE